MNELKKGMKFHSYKELCDFSGIKYDKHRTYLISKIHQICKTHLENTDVIVDDVFGKVSDIKYKNQDYLYNIGDIVPTKTGKVEILEQIKIYKSKQRGYKYLCLLHGYIGENSEFHLKNGVGCPVCSNKKCINGINSIYDQRKDLLKYIANEDDARKYTTYSGKKILCKCPVCNYTKMVAINNLSTHGFSCNFCSDGLSYPNKFVYCFLNQLKIDYIPEKIFDWCTNRKYDVYINSLNMIIENHVEQHYKRCFESLGGRTLEEEQENDLFKYKTAKENNISYYIVLNCSESKLSYIKNSIMSSDLPMLLHFSEGDIDWELCHSYASKSIIKEVCEFWEANYKNMTYTKEHFNLDIHTVMEYLEKGAIIGYCSYKKKHTSSRSLSSKQATSKPIYNIENNICFFSWHECEQYFKEKLEDKTFYGHGLYSYINNSKKYHNNTFVYIDKYEYNNYKLLYEKGESPIVVVGDFYLERYIR